MRALLPQRRPEQQRDLRLWPIGLVLALAFGAAIIASGAAFITGRRLLHARDPAPEHTSAPRRCSTS
ncbi:hypothetical protein [Streptomyces sp. NPDC054783]